MALKTYPWNIDEYLQTPEDMIAYLEAAFEEGDPSGLALAIEDVARVRGIDLPKSEVHPELTSLLKIMKALGLELARKAA
jgi:DNA-binding phage protein